MPVVFLMTGLVLITLVIARSSIGHAIAEAIRYNSGASQVGAPPQEFEELRAEVEQLRAELDGVHQQLAENVERLDFTERMLTAQHEALPPKAVG